MQYYQAWAIANKIIHQIQPWCSRVEIAGSIRRLKPEVKDIEIVCEPLPKINYNLLGIPSTSYPLYQQLDKLIAGKLLKGSERYRQYALLEGIKLDLFMVIVPAQYGVILAIRTGPVEYSKKLVTQRQYGGLLPNNLRVTGGAVWEGKKVYSTLTERDFFDLLGLEWLEPEQRA